VRGEGEGESERVGASAVAVGASVGAGLRGFDEDEKGKADRVCGLSVMRSAQSEWTTAGDFMHVACREEGQRRIPKLLNTMCVFLFFLCPSHISPSPLHPSPASHPPSHTSYPTSPKTSTYGHRGHAVQLAANGDRVLLPHVGAADARQAHDEVGGARHLGERGLEVPRLLDCARAAPPNVAEGRSKIGMEK
jgi:hypothetical protein